MIRAAAIAAVGAAVALAACGDSGPQTEVTASGDEDRGIADAVEEELALYSEPFDISALPVDQQDQLAPVYDAFPRAAGSVEELTVSDGAIEASTDLPVDEDSEITARLICGALVRAAARDDASSHRVLGSGDAVLLECGPSDAEYP